MATALAPGEARKTPARLAGSAVLALQSDERLVGLVRDGHERAFEAIVERYRKPLVRYCGRFLPESRSEDAVQQAFVNAHAALLASEDPVQLKPWLYTLARNAALNMLRQNGWNYEQIPADLDGVLRPDQAVEQKIELQQTVAAVNGLPERQRDAIVLRELEGRSYEEIAVALGANDGAVRQLLNRARGTLRAAASAFVPPPLVTRIASSLPPSDGRRAAEVLGSFGAAGIVKVAATAVVAGSLVVGAVKAPLIEHHGARPAVARDPAGANASAAGAVATERNSRARGNAADERGHSHGRQDDSRHAGGERSGRNGSRHGDDRSRSGSRSRGDSDTSGSSGGSDDHAGGNSGSGSHDQTTSTEDVSGSSRSGTSGSGRADGGSDGSGSSGSGTSGSDSSSGGSTDGVSGDSGSSGAETSGSGTSGSGTSGSGTSGSGSDSGLLGTDSSGSGSSASGSISSGSGISGSGTSGSGSTSGTSGSDDH